MLRYKDIKILRVVRSSLTVIMLLASTGMQAQDENAYLRRKVDSLETVIRDLRRKASSRNSISSLGSDDTSPSWLSRTGYFDSLGDINAVEEVVQTSLYSEVNFMEFPYDELIGRMVETFSKAQASLWGGILGRWFAYKESLEGYFVQKGLPAELAMVCVIESGCSPKALSRAGAAGFWQFMPQTGRDFGLRVDETVDERLDIDKSTACAVKYFQNAYRMLGSWDAAVASYNWGVTNVSNAMKKYGQDIRDYYERMPEETQSYLPSLIAALWLDRHYNEAGLTPTEFDGNIIARRITEDYTFEEIEKITGIPTGILRRYNPQYIREIIPGSEGTYYLKVNNRYRNNLNKL